MPGIRYVNVRTNNIVETRNEGPAAFTIVTVTDDGYGPRRRVPSTSFHKNFLAENGQPHSSGYVPVCTLPGSHPAAMNTEIDRMELLERLDAMSTAELSDVIAEQQKVMEEAKALVDRAKTIAKSRRRDPGLELYGDVALVYSSNERFDEKYALKNLATDDLKRICIPKPDATTARAAFRNEPDKLKLCMKSHGLKLEVRPATDEDRLKALAERGTPADEEDFELDEPPF